MKSTITQVVLFYKRYVYHFVILFLILKVNLCTSRRTQLQQKIEMSVSFVILSCFCLFVVMFCAIIASPANRHLNGVSLASPWWPNIEFWPSSFEIFRGSGPVLLRKPICVIFKGGGPDPRPPSGSAHASQEIFSHVGTFPGLNQ